MSAERPNRGHTEGHALESVRSFNRYFREKFRQGKTTIAVPELGRVVKIVDVSPQKESNKLKVPVIIVPGWTEDQGVLKTSMRALVKYGHHAITYTPGKLLNPNRENYPQAVKDAVHKLRDLESKGDEGKAVLKGLMKHKRFHYNVQKALELLAIINNNPQDKVDLVAHSQGLIVSAIAAILEPDKVRDIVGIGGAGIVGGDKFSKLVGRFGIHFVGSSVRSVTHPKDAWKITRGGMAAGRYFGKNRTQALREGSAIGRSEIYDSLAYLKSRHNIQSALIHNKSDRLFPYKRVESAHNAFNQETGQSIDIYKARGGHNEYYVRADEQMVIVDRVFENLERRRASK